MFKKKKKFPFLELLCILLLAAIDQYSKYLAVLNLKDRPPRILLEGVLELDYYGNEGGAWGIFPGQMIFFIFVTLVVLLAIIYVLIKLPRSKKYRYLDALLVIVAAGAIGNMIDRVRMGYVVDFISFVLINFPVFNVADIYVTTGMFGLIYLLMFYYKEEDLYFLSFKNKSYREV